MKKQGSLVFAVLMMVCLASIARPAMAQTITQRPGVPSGVDGKLPTPPPPPVPLDYVIGPGDILTVVVYGEKDATGDVVVRPDGMVSVPLLNDIKAAGLTPEKFRASVEEAAKKMYTEPNVTIIVKEIRSRFVTISGSVTKQGPYQLLTPLNIVELISFAGGLLDWADKKDILIIRSSEKDAKGQPVQYHINYDDLMKGKNLAKNLIQLKPGDSVIVK